MNGRNRSRSSPFSYRREGGRFEVATTTTPASNRARNRRSRIIASAMSLTWNSSKHNSVASGASAARRLDPVVHVEHEGVEMHPPLRRDRRGGEEQVHQHRLAAPDRAPQVDAARPPGVAAAPARQPGARPRHRDIAVERAVQAVERGDDAALRRIGPHQPAVAPRAVELAGRLTQSAAAGSGSDRVPARALPMNNRLASHSAATSGSTRSARPASISMPYGTGMIAPPSASPALTKPNSLPIWPGGAASLTITSRGVRLAPISRPVANSSATAAACGRTKRLTATISPAPTTVSPKTKANSRSVRSATQPPSKTPLIVPTMKPGRHDDAASRLTPWVVCSTVISHACTPAPAIDDTMKKPKNSKAERDSSMRAPPPFAAADAAGARFWSERMRL